MPQRFIHEDLVTYDPELFFPNVQSCAAIIVTSSGSTDIGGYHITVGSSDKELLAAGQHISSGLNGNIDRVYVVGNFSRDGASGAGANGRLGPALRVALNYPGHVWYLQSSNEWINGGIAVSAQFATTGPGGLEIRVAAPGAWRATGQRAACGPHMQRIRSTGALVDVPGGTVAEANFTGAPAPFALGSFSVA
jgi:hypothetical protein